MKVKRSKSEERRKKMKYRQNRSTQKILADREKDKERKQLAGDHMEGKDEKKDYDPWEDNKQRMQKIRQTQTQEEKDLEKEKLFVTMRKLRKKQSQEKKDIEREKNKERMALLRSNNKEDYDYDKVINRQRKRKRR